VNESAIRRGRGDDSQKIDQFGSAAAKICQRRSAIAIHGNGMGRDHGSRPWFNLGQDGGRSSISGSIGETALGTSNKSLTAGFKRSW